MYANLRVEERVTSKVVWVELMLLVEVSEGKKLERLAVTRKILGRAGGYCVRCVGVARTSRYSSLGRK